ncbi:hypothetical protein G7Y89_g10832 [Cudoniella acicularis]|uniref:Threonylcarbamoyl-AMP synthase n=1 Tax=Cudoniella acicularis TaxID=354080 RepID=A0A8H4RFM4_9HELO|nr:hypothetical protein G7Y89_g10832 [Cudoniella acicularis]
MGSNPTKEVSIETRILPVDTSDLGKFENRQTLEKWELPTNTTHLEPLQKAAHLLRESSIPVGFPTETVYGLGADATRSDAVKGIYKAKGRPSDNPLIIHVCDLTMLRSLLAPVAEANGDTNAPADPIPEIYKPLIQRFWPGPLTILLPNPTPSKLAPEVTAGLPSFGARMTDSPLALSLIKLAGFPIAAPSANASTKPSPTTAQHVLHDLNGRIELILDGGACHVGVESTVVDGTCDPPVVLRPGGLSIDEIRQCPGWEKVTRGYKDSSEIGAAAPRAPGMKYKHYSPKAKVVLFEAASARNTGTGRDTKKGIPLQVWRVTSASENKQPHLGLEEIDRPFRIGIVRTRHWQKWAGFHLVKWTYEQDGCGIADLNLTADGSSNEKEPTEEQKETPQAEIVSPPTECLLHTVVTETPPKQSGDLEVTEGRLLQGAKPFPYPLDNEGPPYPRLGPKDKDVGGHHIADLIQISLGSDTKDIAHGLFSALRELDLRDVDVIYVEGIEDEGDIAAAVMNRLRKAATVIEK